MTEQLSVYNSLPLRIIPCMTYKVHKTIPLHHHPRLL